MFASRTATAESPAIPLKGRISHSVCRWCYRAIPLDTLCEQAKRIGLGSIEILKLDDVPTLKKHGLTCAMLSGVPGDIPKGLNRLENHEAISAFFADAIPRAADAGCPNMICFSGNRAGMSDAEGLENCVKGIKQFIAHAEKHQVTICMELLNSKVNHHDYMCDHTAWGVELCKRVGSERFKLLYDIYHMQIMEGDIIRTIQKNHEYFGHYHTGGVPGRHEIDDSQEICYPPIMKAILETGYRDGWLRDSCPPDRTRWPPSKSAFACVMCEVQIPDSGCRMKTATAWRAASYESPKKIEDGRLRIEDRNSARLDWAAELSSPKSPVFRTPNSAFRI